MLANCNIFETWKKYSSFYRMYVRVEICGSWNYRQQIQDGSWNYRQQIQDY
jgi:hypothetical protein